MPALFTTRPVVLVCLLTNELLSIRVWRLGFDICPDLELECLAIDKLCRGDVLNGDTNGFVQGHFTGTTSSGFGSCQHFADFTMDIVLSDVFLFDREQDITALGHDRIPRIDDYLRVRHSRAVDFSGIRP